MKLKLVTVIMAAMLASGCASIVSDSKYPVAINSTPDGANFVITNRDGIKVHSGKTPSSVTLAASAGFFRGEKYTITFTKDGHTSKSHILDSGLDGWYIGNILFGGLIGILIVDPATGAMFKLPPNVSVHLDAKTAANTATSKLTVASIDSLTPEQIKQLQPIN